MRRKMLALLIANLLAAPAFAQDTGITGSVSVGGISVDDKDAVDASKLNEYRDMDDGLLTQFDVRGRGARYWFDAYGENLGREDVYAAVRGGTYDVFKYRVYHDALKHNFLFNGITPYNGWGTALQTATFPRLDTTTWNSIDEVAYKRRDTGGFFELQVLNPWYFRADANVVKTSGTKYGSSSQGMSPGNGYVDLIFPVEYETRTSVVEAGYNSKRVHGAISWMASKFENENESFEWTNGFWGNGLDRTYQGADNKYTRLAGNLTFRGLPLASTLAFRFTRDELESDVNLTTSVLNTAAGAFATTGPSSPTFNGDIENQTFSAVWSASPARNLDLRVYGNSYEREDNSTHLVFNGTAASDYRNEPFSYDKVNFGIEAGFRINRGNRIAAGYDYLDTEREGRNDFDNTKDKRFFVEYKNTMLDTLAARIKYQRLERDSNFLRGNEGTGTGDPNYLNRFVTAFDLAGVDQDLVKVSLDFSPVPNLDLGLEAISKRNKFRDNVIGRLKDDREELYVNASYVMPAGVRFSVFADTERVTYDSRHRTGVTGTTVGTYDPFAPPTAATYNWEGKVKDRNTAYGVAVDIPVMKRLTIKASAIHYKADGSTDLSLQEGVPASVVRPVSLVLVDDSKRTSFTLKAIYEFSRAWTITGGYAYERFEYADEQFEGYRYTIPAANRADSYLNGYFANPEYKASILFALVTYRF